jgi:CBS domain-containing protein
MPTQVKDVMTMGVVVAHPTTPVKQVAGLLADHGLSALPVVDGRGRVLGVVSEADLLGNRQRHGDGPAAATASEVMASPAVTVTPQATVTEAARRMQAGGVKRLPVVAGSGRLVGIVRPRRPAPAVDAPGRGDPLGDRGAARPRAAGRSRAGGGRGTGRHCHPHRAGRAA